MFVVHHSHRTEALVDSLAEVLRPATSSPFVEDVVVVHGKGLERWLEMQLAERLGICANVRFPSPGALIADVATAVLGEEADLTAWSGDCLVWSIRAALRAVRDEPALTPIRTYVEAGGSAEESRRSQGLSIRLARIFERLAVYRPEVVAKWRAGEGEGWEPLLWRAVADRIAGDDVGTAIRALEKELDTGTFDASLPGRVALFSVTTLAPLQVRAFAALGRRRDVHLLQLHPSPVWWDKVAATGATTAEHPLLASMGRVVGDMQLALEEIEGSKCAGDATPVEASTTLAAIQADIHADAITGRAFDPDDRSVQLHACHGPMRQVQVLREVLLDLFEEYESLQPRDVVVMAPDIETYAPLVDAVFSDGEPWERRHEHAGNLPRIPFRLADRGVRSQNPVAEALLSLLALAGGRLRASSMLDLLAMGPVRTRFGVGADDLPQVREWVATCGVRWARDAGHRATEGQPGTDEYTWRYGLSRMLLGQAVLGADERVLGVSPFGEVEGRDERELLGKVVDFAEAVFEVLDTLDGERAVAEWSDLMSSAVDALFRTEPAETWQVLRVHDGLASMAEAASDAGLEEEVDLASITAALEGRFGVREPGAGYLSGAVTFCQLVPMRSIPFEVICLLGMDDGQFPRIGARPGFDRMASEHRVGDRTPRDDDRALFLEALMSARRNLVIMTTGRGVKDDRPRPPAVPVSELLDVIDATFGEHDGRMASEHLTTQHPLLPFSARAFGGRYGFDTRMRDAAEAARIGLREPERRPAFLPSELPPPPSEIEIDLRALCQFWQHPMRFLCQRRLGIWLRDDGDPVEDREPLELGNLERWGLRARLLDWALDGELLDVGAEAYARVRGEARLPLGTPGRVIYESAAEQARAIADRATALRQGTSGPTAPVSVEVEAQGVRLTGVVGDMHGALRVAAQASRVQPKTQVAVWIEHLALAAAGQSVTTHVIGHGGEARFSPVERDEAREQLARLLEMYRAGQRAPLPFFPSTSLAFYEGLVARDAWEGNRRARKAWDSFDEPGPYGLLVLGEVYPFYPGQNLPIPLPCSVEELARAVWEPALRFREAAV